MKAKKFLSLILAISMIASLFVSMPTVSATDASTVTITQEYPWKVEQGPFGGGSRVEGYTTSAYEGNYALAMMGVKGEWSKPEMKLNLDNAVSASGLKVTFMHKGEGFDLYSMWGPYNADDKKTVSAHSEWTEVTVEFESLTNGTSQALLVRAEKNPWDDSYILIDNLKVQAKNSDGSYGDNVFANSGFEYLEEPTSTSTVTITQEYPWKVEQGPFGGGSRVEGYTTSAYEGKYALAMMGVKGEWSKPEMKLNLDNAVSASGLKVTFMHKGEGFDLYSMWGPYNADDKKTVSAHSEWTEVTVEFESLTNGTSQALLVRAEKNPWDDSYILIDNLKVFSIGSGVSDENLFSNSGFEYLDNPTPPKLKADNIKIYAGDVEQLIAGNVSAYADKVTVDFGQKMLPTDLTADNIYVTEKGSTTKLTYDAKINGNIYEMSFTNGFTPGKTYTVTVNKIKNISENEMSQSYSFDFTVKAGISADLINVTIDDNEVTTAAGMVAGKNASINIQYNNSTTDEPTIYVIVAYYKGNTLAKCEYLPWSTAGSSTLNYKIPYPVPTVDGGFDEVNVMVWDGFNTMKPLSKAINLK